MEVLLQDQESESRRLGPWLELPPSPPRSVWAAVVAAWVSCCLRCRRLAQAGCSVDGAVAGASLAACAAPPPDADPASSGRKAAAMRSFIDRAPSATFCPAACAPVLATLPTPAAAPFRPPPAEVEPRSEERRGGEECRSRG